MQREARRENVLFQVLSIAEFRSLWIAQVISQITVNMFIFVLGVVIYQKTSSNTAVSLLYVCFGIPAAIFGIISGVYVDRFKKKQLLIGTALVRTALLIMLFFSGQHLIPMYLIGALVSVVSQFFVPAEAALIPQFVTQRLLLGANSLFTLTFYSAIIGGFVAGGPLLAFFGWQSLLLLLAGAFAVSGLFLIWLPKEELGARGRVEMTLQKVLEDMKAGLSYIHKTSRVRAALLLLLLAQAVIAIFATLGPGFADRILLIPITDASVFILAPAALGMIFGAILISQIDLKVKRRQIITAAIIISGLLFIFIALLTQSPEYRLPKVVHASILPIAIGSFFLLGFANSMIDVTCNTVLQEETDDTMRGRVYGVLASLVGGLAIVPVFFSGILADLLGVAAIVFLLGIGLIGFGLYAFKMSRHVSPS